jgi:hypothetical protein
LKIKMKRSLVCSPELAKKRFEPKHRWQSSVSSLGWDGSP